VRQWRDATRRVVAEVRGVLGLVREDLEGLRPSALRAVASGAARRQEEEVPDPGLAAAVRDAIASWSAGTASTEGSGKACPDLSAARAAAPGRSQRAGEGPASGAAQASAAHAHPGPQGAGGVAASRAARPIVPKAG
jgi:hypothetical protein